MAEFLIVGMIIPVGGANMPTNAAHDLVKNMVSQAPDAVVIKGYGQSGEVEDIVTEQFGHQFLGAAEKMQERFPGEAAVAEAEPDGNDEPDDDEADDEPDWDGLTKAQIQDVAADYGIAVDLGWNKAEMLQKVREAYNDLPDA